MSCVLGVRSFSKHLARLTVPNEAARCQMKAPYMNPSTLNARIIFVKSSLSAHALNTCGFQTFHKKKHLHELNSPTASCLEQLRQSSQVTDNSRQGLFGEAEPPHWELVCHLPPAHPPCAAAAVSRADG